MRAIIRSDEALDARPAYLAGVSLRPFDRSREGFTAQDLRAALQDLAIDASNFHVLHHRHVDGMLVTAKNSGTHWLKFMLGHAIAHDFGVPAPAHSSGAAADDIIGNPKVPPRHPHLPRLTSTHTIPSALVASKLVRRILPCPPAVVLVRDIRTAMISNYVKWRGTVRHGDAAFADYVRGDVTGRRFVADAWWYTRFLNRWGDIAMAFPAETLIVRYEDIQAAPAEAMRLIAGHFGIDLSAAAVAAGLQIAGRETMRDRLDPAYDEAIVSDERKRATVSFSDEDTEVLRSILRRHLKYDYGYAYF
ncbi:MAG TPA: sulfotransferase domain-containing protein [Parvibaculum sp.]